MLVKTCHQQHNMHICRALHSSGTITILGWRQQLGMHVLLALQTGRHPPLTA
jgi:hypothetical protein